MPLLCGKFPVGEEAVDGSGKAQRPALLNFCTMDGMVWCYLRPVRGCTSGGCDRAGGATICLGLLTFVLDLANSSRMVWGRSGSNLTPCCKKNWCETRVLVLHSWLGQGGKRDVELRNLLFPAALIVGQVKLTGGRKGAKSWLFRLV